MMVKAAPMSSRRKSSKIAIVNEINVTPLVDVMLVLLVVFMVTSPLMVAGVHVDLPSSQAAPIAGEEEPLSVTVDNQGAVYIQNTSVSLSELKDKLKAITHEKTDSRIFVRGDKTVDYGKVMEVVGIINEAGYEKVSLITEVKSK